MGWREKLVTRYGFLGTRRQPQEPTCFPHFHPQTQDTVTCDTLYRGIGRLVFGVDGKPCHISRDTYGVWQRATCETLDVLLYKVSHVSWSWASWLWGGWKNVANLTVSSEQDANPKAPKHVPPFALPQPQGQDTVTCDTLHVLQYKVSHVTGPVTCDTFCPLPKHKPRTP